MDFIWSWDFLCVSPVIKEFSILHFAFIQPDTQSIFSQKFSEELHLK